MSITTKAQITVLFDDPFWVMLFERESKSGYEVCKVTFGAEPKDSEVFEFLLKNYGRLRFCSPVRGKAIEERRLNPKRLRREAKKATEEKGIGTKAQQALKLQYEQNKLEKSKRSKEQRLEKEKRLFELRREKKKQKKKGH